MFKKGQIQLQVEIRSDEDLDQFLQRDGICVLDVHPSWCGPCVSMLSTLKKLKFEIGDSLSLGECTADTINKLSRFSNRCEPTFLICSHQKVVRSVFSASIPKLVHAIKEELEREHLHKLGKIQRVFYDFDKQSPGEIERDAEKVAKEKKIQRIAKEKADKEFHDKLEFIIAQVAENIPDTWLTVFFPHTAPYYNKTFEAGRELGMIYRDKNNTRLMEESVPYLMYKNKNPWDPDLINYMLNKDLLCVLWVRNAVAKISGFTVAAPRFLKQITNPPPPKVEKPEEKDTAELEVPTGPTNAEIFKTLIIPLVVEKPAEDQESPNEKELESHVKFDQNQIHPGSEQEEKPEETEKEKEVEEQQEKDHTPEDPPEEISPESDVEQKVSTENQETPEKVENDVTAEEQPAKIDDEEGEKQDTTEESEDKSADDIPEVAVESTESIVVRELKTSLEIPPIWIPFNEEANALAIHVFFRRLTQYFVPPDPEPEPNHVCIIFPSSARKEIYEIFKTFEREIPLYGFFTSDNLRETKVISKSYQKYEMKSPNDDDKLIMKVNRRNDQALLAFAQLNPIYISMNDREGHEDCTTVFNNEFMEFLDEIEDPNRGEKRRSSRRKSSVIKPDYNSAGKSKEISTEIETIAETLIDTEEP